MWELLPVRIFKQKNNPKYEWILNLCLAHSILSLMDPSPKLGCHQTYQTNLVIIILRVIKSHQIATFAASLAFFRFLRRTRSAASLKRKGSAAVRSLQALEASVEEGSTSESWLNLGPMSWEKWWQFKKTPSLFSYTIRVQNSYRYGWYGDLHRPVHCKIRSHLSQLSKHNSSRARHTSIWVYSTLCGNTACNHNVRLPRLSMRSYAVCTNMVAFLDVFFNQASSKLSNPERKSPVPCQERSASMFPDVSSQMF